METGDVTMTYRLRCLEGGEYVEERNSLRCSDGHTGLLRAEYDARRLTIRDLPGIFKYSDWLPVRSSLPNRTCPVAFRNEDLNRELGLPNLWIGFTGYYPERGAFAESCTFKELEALPTFARLNDCGGGRIVLASAGNTARAFAQTAESTGSGITIVVPERSSDRLDVREDTGKVRLISVKGDYTDAIAVADRIAAFGDHVPEGGARNVARRDGMGTVALEGALAMGRIPDHYFQGVGSGTGGIAAWEACMRLIGDGGYGDRLPRLHLAQNSPFTPMANAWKAGRRSILPEDMPDAKTAEAAVYADVLTNRAPPYGMAGGVFDAMTDCGGEFITVTNDMARSAERLWMQFENARPDPAASVAFASLLTALESGTVGRDDHILLNMTGGGSDRVREDVEMTKVRSFATVPTDISDEELRRIVYE